MKLTRIPELIKYIKYKASLIPKRQKRKSRTMKDRERHLRFWQECLDELEELKDLCHLK